MTGMSTVHRLITVTTTNSAPVANAGPDQSVPLGVLVTLNGSASTDVDGDPDVFLGTYREARGKCGDSVRCGGSESDVYCR